MLNRVSAALSRLIRPIATSIPSGVQNKTDGESAKHPPFQRHTPSSDSTLPDDSAISPTETKSPQAADVPIRPGLTSSFLQILQKMSESRSRLRLFGGSKPYGKSNSKKISTLRKGMVVDDKAG